MIVGSPVATRLASARSYHTRTDGLSCDTKDGGVCPVQVCDDYSYGDTGSTSTTSPTSSAAPTTTSSPQGSAALPSSNGRRPLASVSPSRDASALPRADGQDDPTKRWRQVYDSMRSGGPVVGPVPLMPDGSCLVRFLTRQNQPCYPKRCPAPVDSTQPVGWKIVARLFSRHHQRGRAAPRSGDMVAIVMPGDRVFGSLLQTPGADHADEEQ